jgi:hypothetical protein
MTDDILDISKSELAVLTWSVFYFTDEWRVIVVNDGRMTVEVVTYYLRQTVFGIPKTLVVHSCLINLTYDVDHNILDQPTSDRSSPIQ